MLTIRARRSLQMLLALGVLAALPLEAQRLRGVIYDSLLTRGPMVGARVVVDGVSQTATTDRRGRFAIEDVPEGEHLVTFYHPSLDSARLSAPAYRVTVPSRGLRDLRMATPSFATTSQYLCGAALDSGSTIVLGRALAVEDGRVLSGATARVAWWEMSFGGDEGVQRIDREMTAETDSSGQFRLCGIPTDVDLTMTVRQGSQQSGPIAFPERGRAITIRDVAVSLSDTAASVTADSLYIASPDSVRPGRARLRVRVRDESGQPIENAIVGIRGHAAAATSSADGLALVMAAPSGTQTVAVRALGWEQRVSLVTLKPDQETELDLRLMKIGAILPEYRVTGIREDPGKAGFERRQRMGFGTFLDKERLDRIGRRTSNLNLVGGIRVPMTQGTLGYSPFPMILLRNDLGLCTPTIWVDGVPRVRMDGWELHAILQWATRMEIYPRAILTPAEFVGSGQCGVVVIWTTP
jgi:hypothetical protein